MSTEHTDSLVARYRDAAVRHGSATATLAVNAAADEIADCYRRLRALGSDATSGLLVLLADDVPSVRSWASAHALESAPEQGEAALVALAAGPAGTIKLTTEITLREWREGRLRFP